MASRCGDLGSTVWAGVELPNLNNGGRGVVGAPKIDVVLGD